MNSDEKPTCAFCHCEIARRESKDWDDVCWKCREKYKGYKDRESAWSHHVEFGWHDQRRFTYAEWQDEMRREKERKESEEWHKKTEFEDQLKKSGITRRIMLLEKKVKELSGEGEKG